MEQNLVDVFFFGKKYSVPENLTIMTAMEYAGYKLVRGCGCRNGFCVLVQQSIVSKGITN